MTFFFAALRVATFWKNVFALSRFTFGSPGVSVWKSMIAYIPRASAWSTRLFTCVVKPAGLVVYPPSLTYMAMRKTSAFQSFASVSSEFVL
jgi:hypothetical protein